MVPPSSSVLVPASRETFALPGSALDAIGNTPLVTIRGLPEHAGTVVAKLEGSNPGGSAKDRTAASLLRSAMQRGDLLSGGHVVESTSGNLGIGLAQAAAVLGVRLSCVVDSRCPQLSVQTMRALGARVIEISEPDRPGGDLLAARLAAVRDELERDPTAFWPNQYENQDNPTAHMTGTMTELDDRFDGALNTLLVATSTTGTLQGCSRLLRERGRTTRVIAVDAEGSALFGGTPRPRMLPGYGAGVEPVLARDADPDDVVRVGEAETIAWCRHLSRANGFLLGASSGAVAAAAARTLDDPNGLSAMIFADRGIGYLDTVYDDAWVAQHVGALPEVG